MSWGDRRHPSDTGFKTTWGEKPCPRCGKLVTTNSWGFKSHMRSCLSKELIIDGKKFPPADQEYIDKWYPRKKS